MKQIVNIIKIVSASILLSGTWSSAHAAFEMYLVDSDLYNESATDSVTGDNITAQLSGWANTSSYATGNGGGSSANDEFVSYNLSSYSSGIVINRNESSPEHAIDNYGPEEFVLFVFNQPVVLTDLWIGWPDNTYDTDMTVLAYTGTDSYNSTYMPNLNSDPTDTTGTTRGLTNAGWDLVGDPNYSGHLSNVDSDKYVSIKNTGNVASTHWLVGAYNKYLSGAVSGITNDDDYAKLKKIRGFVNETPGCQPGDPCNGTVPSPATAALLGLGLLLLRKRKLI